MIHMEYYLVVSTIMMFAGIYGFFTRRNLLAMLISVELILNSVDINFVVFNRFLFPGQLEGFFFALFAIGVSAAETAVAILRAVFHCRGRCRNGRRHRHHHQYLPEYTQYSGEEHE
mgnify:CR=1 FL=1